MKLLIIGDADSIFIKNMIYYLFLNTPHTVSILTANNTKFKEFYNDSNVKVYECPIPASGSLPFRFYKYMREIKSSFTRIRFDIIHIHFVSIYGLLANRFLKHKNTKTIITFWGSDLFRITSATLKLYRILIKSSYTITLSTSAMLDRFHKDYGLKYDNNLRMVKFGNGEFDIIASVKKYANPNQLRKDLNLPYDKYIIAVGYNQSPAQQHLKVLEQINLLPEEMQKRIHLVLKLTYGTAPTSYMEEVHAQLCKSMCTYTCYTDFLSDEQIAKLEAVTDVFIHAQISDAFSATIQEHIYAGALLINPVWIHYQELNDAQIYYVEYKNFEELNRQIRNYLNRPDFYKDQLKHNPAKIYSISSWDSVLNSWKSLYGNL